MSDRSSDVLPPPCMIRECAGTMEPGWLFCTAHVDQYDLRPKQRIGSAPEYCTHWTVPLETGHAICVASKLDVTNLKAAVEKLKKKPPSAYAKGDSSRHSYDEVVCVRCHRPPNDPGHEDLGDSFACSNAPHRASAEDPDEPINESAEDELTALVHQYETTAMSAFDMATRAWMLGWTETERRPRDRRESDRGELLKCIMCNGDPACFCAKCAGEMAQGNGPPNPPPDDGWNDATRANYERRFGPIRERATPEPLEGKVIGVAGVTCVITPKSELDEMYELLGKYREALLSRNYIGAPPEALPDQLRRASLVARIGKVIDAPLRKAARSSGDESDDHVHEVGGCRDCPYDAEYRRAQLKKENA